MNYNVYIKNKHISQWNVAEKNIQKAKSLTKEDIIDVNAMMKGSVKMDYEDYVKQDRMFKKKLLDRGYELEKDENNSYIKKITTAEITFNIEEWKFKWCDNIIGYYISYTYWQHSPQLTVKISKNMESEELLKFLDNIEKNIKFICDIDESE